jgi:glycosyltransferase involved in cell wall biosynthesis
MMHVGIDGRELQDHMTGIGRFLSEALLHFVSLRPQWKWTLFHTNDRAVASYTDYQTIRLSNSSVLVQDQWEIPRFARKTGIDVLFSPYYKLPWFLPCPGLVVVHDVNVLHSPEYDSFKGRVYRCHFSLNLQVSIRRAARVFAVSNWTRTELLRRFWVEAEKVKVNYQGVRKPPQNEVHPEWERFRQEERIDHEYFLYVGNLKPHKNLLFLLDVYEQLPSELQRKYKLVIAGNHSPYGTIIEKKIREKQLTDRVRLIGHVRDDLLNDLYRTAHLFLFPSLLEGFGFPPLEAMARGVPVVSSNATSLQEVVGEGGWTLDPAEKQDFIDAIVTLCEDSVRYEEFRQRGKSWVQQFSSEKNAGTIIEELEKLVH